MKNIVTSFVYVLIIIVMAGACTESEIKNKANMDPGKFETELNGKQVSLYKLTNANGLEMLVTNYGGRVVSLMTPDADGNFADIVLGFDSLQQYRTSEEAFFGAAVGRYANRIANGKFSIDGEEYQLPQNDGDNTLHGGPGGFHNVVWDAEKKDEQTLELSYVSPDKEMNFPGRLEVTMTYTLTNKNEFRIYYEATTNKKTVCNLTHHSFFNLSGAGEGTITDHKININADSITPVNSSLIPTGEIQSVKGTPFDFTASLPIGKRIDADNKQLQIAGGYDHNYVLNHEKEGDITLAARVIDPESGRILKVFTDQPGMQLYTGNFLDNIHGKHGKVYDKRDAFCLETQLFPDAPNQPEFPSAVLKPGETYTHTCIYKFSYK